MADNPRRIVLDLLIGVFDNDAYANLSLDRHLSASRLDARDKKFITALFYGVLSHRLLLDWFTAPFVKKAKSKIRLLLALTVYQIQFMDRVPTSAAVDEAVKLARVLEGQQTANFVNAVLRNFMRSGRGNERPKDWETRYSMPKFLLDKFVAQFGGKRTGEILESLELPSKMSLRVIDPTVQLADTKPSVLSPVGLVADGGNLAATEAFREGRITIQDESSQLVAPLLELTGTEEVLDACAAPGGKTAHIAQYLTTGRVTALDLYEHKLRLIAQNASRLQLTDKIKTRKLDATRAAEVFDAASFDRILVDAPCSGLGLLRRKPDIRYRKESGDFEALQKIQLSILASCAILLKKNGIMVYSTCTLFDEENFDVVKIFLDKHKDFVQVPLKHEKSDIVNDGCLFITPELYQTDGFFIAKFKKID